MNNLIALFIVCLLKFFCFYTFSFQSDVPLYVAYYLNIGFDLHHQIQYVVFQSETSSHLITL